MSVPSILCVGGVSIDSIVRPDGLVARNLLGGNAAYAGFGASCWLPGGSVRLAAVVGDDFPDAWLDALTDAGIDVAGVERRTGQASISYAVAYEDGENRHDVLAVELDGAPRDVSDGARVPGSMEPRLTRGAPALSGLAGVCFGPVQPEVLAHNLGVLDHVNLVTTLVDPGEESLLWDDAMRTWVLERADVYCPSAGDLPTGWDGDALETTRALALAGPGIVVLKLGARGVLVRAGDRALHIPALPVEVRDPTGAGDAFCGAFLAGLVRWRDPFVAGVLGVASAAAVVEAEGLLDCLARPCEVTLRYAQQAASTVGLTVPLSPAR